MKAATCRRATRRRAISRRAIRRCTTRRPVPVHPQRRRTIGIHLCFAAALCVGLAACGRVGRQTASGAGQGTNDCPAVSPVALRIDVDREVPHDPTSYTQGLVMGDGVVYESSGRYGESRLSTVDPATGSVMASIDLDPGVFAEGLAIGGGEGGHSELVQLTWKEGTAYRWPLDGLDASSRPIGTFNYSGEGWGLTTLGNGRLLMSDGSDTLTERDPRTFDVIATHVVRRSNGMADRLNELEWDGESVWANRYQTDEVLRIDPECWQVTGVADGSDLRARAEAEAERRGLTIDVLNGIAFDRGTGRYLLAGKWWPMSFEVTIGPDH